MGCAWVGWGWEKSRGFTVTMSNAVLLQERAIGICNAFREASDSQPPLSLGLDYHFESLILFDSLTFVLSLYTPCSE